MEPFLEAMHCGTQEMLTEQEAVYSEVNVSNVVLNVSEHCIRQNTVGDDSSQGSFLAEEESFMSDDADDTEAELSSKLQRASLRGNPHQPLTSEFVGQRETCGNSLDRFEQTTDRMKFIQDEWGTQGTMIKILKQLQGSLEPVTVESLLTEGPIVSGYKGIIAALCFTSLAKLKQRGLINIIKDPDTLEITNLTLRNELVGSNDRLWQLM